MWMSEGLGEIWGRARVCGLIWGVSAGASHVTAARTARVNQTYGLRLRAGTERVETVSLGWETTWLARRETDGQRGWAGWSLGWLLWGWSQAGEGCWRVGKAGGKGVLKGYGRDRGKLQVDRLIYNIGQLFTIHNTEETSSHYPLLWKAGFLHKK